MNAKEQMQALIDGKIIMCDGSMFKLDDNGDLAEWQEWTSGGRWVKVRGDAFDFEEDNYILDETKCVDFAHALGMMAQGKVMKCILSDELFRIADGALQTCDAEGWLPIIKGELLSEDEMESMWMEVEE